MNSNIKYVHTNLIAKEWRSLAKFYIDVFNCQPIYPERNLSGEWIDKVTKIEDVNIEGIHLRLPGYKDGPTLEIFEYQPYDYNENEPKINHQGFGHIAFLVEDVECVLHKLIENGGKRYGDVIKKKYEEIGILTVVYARDPQGNFIELQNWKK